jgi:hypothetical protein
MPANQIKHDVKEGKGSKQSLEKKWKEAKDIVKDEYGDDDNHWGVVQNIYQNKRDASAINAASRLKATEIQAAPDYEADYARIMKDLTYALGKPKTKVKDKEYVWTPSYVLATLKRKGDHCFFTMDVEDEMDGGYVCQLKADGKDYQSFQRSLQKSVQEGYDALSEVDSKRESIHGTLLQRDPSLSADTEAAYAILSKL